MTVEKLKTRTRTFGLRVIRLVESLPMTRTADVIARQLLKCGTSVGANYRAACRAKSQADFIAKMGIVEEADESAYWMEMILEAGLVRKEKLADLLDEANQLVAIAVSSIRTAKRNR